MRAFDEIYRIYMDLQNFAPLESNSSDFKIPAKKSSVKSFTSNFDEILSEFCDVKDRGKRPVKPAKRRLSEPKPICTINPNIKKVSPKTKKAKSTAASKEK